MAKTITLRFAGKCADCGATLPVGTRARWYGRGRVYGIGCHAKDGGAVRTGGYCEDYPCCGHTDGDPCPGRGFSVTGTKAYWTGRMNRHDYDWDAA